MPGPKRRRTLIMQAPRTLLARALPLALLALACDPPDAGLAQAPAGAPATPTPKPAGAAKPSPAQPPEAMVVDRETLKRELGELDPELAERAEADADKPREQAPDPAAPPPSAAPTPAPAPALARYRPALLDQAAAPAAITPGEYLCKISKEYKLRPCTVRVDPQGHTMITMPEALLPLEGVLYDEGGGLHLDAWPTEARPFGCFSCAERCAADPSSCECSELPPAATAHCLAQPITAALKRAGEGWKGKLRWGVYFNRYQGALPDRRPIGYEIEDNEMVVEIRPAKK